MIELNKNTMWDDSGYFDNLERHGTDLSRGCHGGSGSSGGGGGGSTNTVQKADPWSGQQPYLTDTFGQAQSLYNNYNPTYYNGTTQGAYGAGDFSGTVAPLSNQTNDYLTAAQNLGTQGTATEGATNTQVNNTLNGDYLNAGNPYLSATMNSAMSAAQPLASKFENSNRYGGGAADNAIASAVTNTLGQSAYQNYNDERARQIQAASLTPNLSQTSWNDLAQLNNAGTVADNYNQNLATANVNKFNYMQQLPYEKLNQYAAITNNGSYGSQGTSTQTQQMYRNPWASAAGGAIAGGLVGNTISGGGMGGAIGAGLGGLLGGMS
jgi:hypothetical protein